MYEILVSVNILVEMDIVTCTGRRLEQPLAGNERHTSFFIIIIIIRTIECIHMHVQLGINH